MPPARLRTVAVVVVDLALLALCLVHLPSVLYRPDVPFEVRFDPSGVVVDTVTDLQKSGGLGPGDRLLTLDGQPIEIPEVIEFLADFGAIGDEVSVTYLREGAQHQALVTLVPFYPTPRFVLIILLVGAITWVVAVVIAWKAEPGIPAAVLHWTLMALAATLLVTPGPIASDSAMSYAVRSVFVLSYPSMAVLFFYFTLLYPTPKIKPSRRTTVVIFGPLVVLVSGLWYTEIRAIMGQSSVWFDHYQVWFDFLHISLLVYTTGSIASIIHSIQRSTTVEERRRLAWIVLGVVLGVTPFLFYILAQIIFSVYLFPEEYTTIFLLAIPFSLMISLLRDRLLNVQLLVSRGILSAVLKGILTVIFALVVLLTISIVFPGAEVFGEHLLLITVTLGLALLINPLRIRVQRVIDETLFAARVRFHRSIIEIGRELQQSLSGQQVFERVVAGLSTLVPADVLSVYRPAGSSLSLVLAAPSMTEIPRSLRLTRTLIEEMVTREVYGLKGSLDPTRRHRESEQIECLEGTGFGVCVPIVSDNHELMGAILIKPRGGKDRLQEEEIDLLISVAREASEVLGRLRLQEQIILEEGEKRRLQELSSLKSDFVSYVSHEFLTPLTSMGFFTDLLLERVSNRNGKNREYLRIIRGETGRLARMVKTILNTARFDSGGTVFHREPQDLVELISGVVESMRYQLDMHRFKVIKSFPRRKLLIDADAESVSLALSNLISNAIKYSPARKHLAIRVRRREGWGVCEIQDRGMGMSPEILTSAFRKFYRAQTLEPHSKGIGLGLALVKQVIDGHHGRVEVRSAPKKGSTFTLWFPLLPSGKRPTSRTLRRTSGASVTPRTSSKRRRKR